MPMHSDFWKSLLKVAEHELLEARQVCALRMRACRCVGARACVHVRGGACVQRDEMDRTRLRGGPDSTRPHLTQCCCPNCAQRDEIDRAHLRGGPDAAAAVAASFAERGLHPDVEEEIHGMLEGGRLYAAAASSSCFTLCLTSCGSRIAPTSALIMWSTAHPHAFTPPSAQAHHPPGCACPTPHGQAGHMHAELVA